jgi:hypothetical protein
MKNPLLELPTTLFYRVQPAIDELNCIVNIKIRQVWGIPQRIVALEYYFFHSILERVYKNNRFGQQTFYSSGLTNFEISRRIVRKFVNKLGNQSNVDSVYSMDYSKFDRTIPNEAIDLFYAIARSQLSLTSKEEKAYNMLRFYIKYTPFVWKKYLYVCLRGIPSGSYLTNLIDTWWNFTLWILSYNMSLYYKKRLREFVDAGQDLLTNLFSDYSRNKNFVRFEDVGLCGDDSIVYTCLLHIKLMQNICSSFHMKININETHYETDEKTQLYFLGRYWDFLGRPVQPDIYFVGHLLIRTKFYPKDSLKFDISEQLYVVRALSILLSHYNGIEFLRKYLSHDNKIRAFLEGGEGFYLLKDWPQVDDYVFINRIDARSWELF